MTDRHNTSYSGLKLLHKEGPSAYHAKRIAKTIPRGKNAGWSILGKMYELLLFGDTEAAGKYEILPEGHDGRKKDGKDRLARIRQEGKEPVYFDTASRAALMATNTLSNPHCRGHLEEPGPMSRRFEFHHGELITVRGEIDKFCENSLRVIDVKSTSKGVRPRAWVRTVGRELYHLQAAIYVDYMREQTGCDDIGFSHIVCSVEAPYECAIYDMEPECLEAGRELYRRLTSELEQHITDNNWLAEYEQKRNRLGAPKWA